MNDGPKGPSWIASFYQSCNISLKPNIHKHIYLITLSSPLQVIPSFLHPIHHVAWATINFSGTFDSLLTGTRYLPSPLLNLLGNTTSLGWSDHVHTLNGHFWTVVALANFVLDLSYGPGCCLMGVVGWFYNFYYGFYYSFGSKTHQKTAIYTSLPYLCHNEKNT